MNDDRVENPQQARMVTIESATLTSNTTVIRVTGDMRGDAAGAVLRTVAGELSSSPEVLVLDLCKVSDMDVVGLDALHTAAGLAAEEDISFRWVDTSDGAIRVRLDAVESAEAFETFSSVADALRHPPDRGTQRFRRALPEQLPILFGESTKVHESPATGHHGDRGSVGVAACQFDARLVQPQPAQVVMSGGWPDRGNAFRNARALTPVAHASPAVSQGVSG